MAGQGKFQTRSVLLAPSRGQFYHLSWLCNQTLHPLSTIRGCQPRNLLDPLPTLHDSTWQVSLQSADQQPLPCFSAPSHLLRSQAACLWRLTHAPVPALLPGKSHGWRSLVGCSPWGREELDTTERLHFSLFTLMHWRRKRQPTPVFLPGESQGWWSLVGCRLWGRTESDMTEAT